MNKRFQLRRFGHALTWTLYGQKGQLLTTLVSLTAMYFILLALTIWMQKDDPDWARQASYYQMTGFCVMAGCAASFVFVTRVFQNLKTKRQRVAYFSLPASAPEKWLCRMVYACVVLPLLVPVAFVLADGLATLFGAVLDTGYVMEGCANYARMLGEMPSASNTPEDARAALIFIYLLLTAALAINGLVLLCSTVFRHALPVSIACMVGLVFLFVHWADHAEFGHYSQGEIELACALVATALLLVGLGELYLSYRVYRRMEVVPGKFTNL